MVLSSEVEKKVDLIAKKFYATTKKNIHITSGTRTPARQAAAMYNKLAQGDRLTIYRNQKAAQQIRKAYDSAKRSGNSRKEIISAMTEVISLQTKAGVFISKHLKAGAVDVQSKTMSPDEKAAFQEAAKETATSVLLETLPPHFHLQF